MTDVPVVRVATKPDTGSMLPTAGILLAQLPPVSVSLSAVVELGHMLSMPEMA